MTILFKIFLVALGSAAGGVARWGLTLGAGRLFGTAFPWGTFIVNITGSFFLGWFYATITERLVDQPGSWIGLEELRLLVAIGFTGGYTTFSSYELEAHNLLKDGSGIAGTIYLMLSVLLGLLAVRCGVMLAQWR
jgi:CrcB protein